MYSGDGLGWVNDAALVDWLQHRHALVAKAANGQWASQASNTSCFSGS
jgi:hypothetical protein